MHLTTITGTWNEHRVLNGPFFELEVPCSWRFPRDKTGTIHPEVAQGDTVREERKSLRNFIFRHCDMKQIGHSTDFTGYWVEQYLNLHDMIQPMNKQTDVSSVPKWLQLKRFNGTTICTMKKYSISVPRNKGFCPIKRWFTVFNISRCVLC